eukprot:TRINITY_DN4799_c0_g1_i4.p1 TRINITY_DN4799_c0_g1~~TRINITY_DN4799_c0_g1_i4.p1  ORF type:complete len:492 (+),score=184.22 TRINITY_DN4799_c0_g1_i4:197-1672(+)
MCIRDRSGLRTQVLSGNFFLAASISASLAKLVVKAYGHGSEFHNKSELQASALELLHELISYGTNSAAISRNSTTPASSSIIDRDSHERIRLCMTLVQNPTNDFILTMVDDSAAAYGNMHRSTTALTSGSKGGSSSAKAPLSLASITSKSTNKSSTLSRSQNNNNNGDDDALSRADQPIIFSQLFQTAESGTGTELSAAADDVLAAVTNDEVDSKDVNSFMRRLHRVKQLSGMNDPVYVEACVTVHQFDVQIDWNIVNLTGDTLSNLAIEVAAIGSMLCDRPQLLTIPPYKKTTLKTSIKVSSTKTHSIYASCLFDVVKADGSNGGGGRQFGARPARRCVVLNEVQDDVMDYLTPSKMTEAEFRLLWPTFACESRVVVDTEINDLRLYIEHIRDITTMAVVGELPDEEEEAADAAAASPSNKKDDDDSLVEDLLGGSSQYMSCFLATKSVFNEDAVAHVSIEQNEQGQLEGMVRVRSVTCLLYTSPSPRDS